MNRLVIPAGYESQLSLYETQTAIGMMKRLFEDSLSGVLNLKRVSAPLFVESGTGINDDLNGIERPVEFDMKETGKNVQVVHSLAKWKRAALKKYGFPAGEGLYTDMNAIRRDDEIDNLHSIYVDQWDWERVILPEWRDEAFLCQTVKSIVHAVCDTSDKLRTLFPSLRSHPDLSRNVHFVTTQELEDTYPGLTPKERENAAAKEHKTVFLMQIGGKLNSGSPHDGRAPDYDDWSLNGDIIFWHDVLGCAIEISSMGIRVNAQSLDSQLELSGNSRRRELMYHKMLLNNELPLTIGGGIGQSRLSMLLLQKAHIGEVQVSVWDDETIEGCKSGGVSLL